MPTAQIHTHLHHLLKVQLRIDNELVEEAIDAVDSEREMFVLYTKCLLFSITLSITFNNSCLAIPASRQNICRNLGLVSYIRTHTFSMYCGLASFKSDLQKTHNFNEKRRRVSNTNQMLRTCSLSLFDRGSSLTGRSCAEERLRKFVCFNAFFSCVAVMVVSSCRALLVHEPII